MLFSVAGLPVAVILFTAAGIAAPVFVVMLVVVLIPWLIWGFVIHRAVARPRQERLVAVGILWAARAARSRGKDSFVSGQPRCNAALHPGAGRLCALDLGIS
jgi:hypothetical protein